ncbi:MAG: DnaJ domain-containing protein [archaeon]|nr:DnaJ domain-containing protein [archaeon]
MGKNATAEEIRKAYRKMVIKMHPDKGGDTEKFQEMQNAYEVLSDPEKRQIYDQYGEEGLKQGMGGSADFDPFSFFGGFGGFGERSDVKRKCKAKLVQVYVSLEEAYNGGSKKVKFDCRVICNKCKGTGSANPNAKVTCDVCHGKGIRLIVQRMGNMAIQTQTTCDACKGSGKKIKDVCKECNAMGVKKIEKEVTIQLDKGVPDGHRYTLRGEGDQYPDIETGDLVLEINLSNHKEFVRKGADLFYKCEISLLQALTGFQLVLTHLDGRKFIVYTKPGEIIKPKQLKTIQELGMPFFGSPLRTGNLYLDFQIVFPEKFSEEESKKLNQIFHNERLHGKKPSPKKVEQYYLQDFNENQENTNHRGGNMDDNEDEDGEPGESTMQCAQQ